MILVKISFLNPYLKHLKTFSKNQREREREGDWENFEKIPPKSSNFSEEALFKGIPFFLQPPQSFIAKQPFQSRNRDRITNDISIPQDFFLVLKIGLRLFKGVGVT